MDINNIKSVIRLEPNEKILQHTVTRLTAPGENYGSLMLRVDVEIEGEEGRKTLNLVAKMLPPSQFIRELFNTDITFRNEIGFYKHIFPVLQSFQKEHGVKKVIDFAPRYFGSRLNLQDDDSEVGEDAILVLENLKVQNFVSLDRIEGLDMEVAKMVLSDLAQLHAVGLGLKLQKPDLFNKTIKPFLRPWICVPDHFQKLKKDLVRLVENTPELQLFKEKIVREFERQMVQKTPREPFATISHNDCWTNNTMVKFDGHKPIKNKVVDYQLCDYGSPAKDVVFFIFSSVKSHVVAKCFDDLLKWYYKVFAETLQELKCDLKQFSFEAFLEEIEFEAKNSQFGHIAFMLFPIMAVKENVKDVAEMTPENIVAEDDSDLLKEKFVFFVNEFVKRKWVYN